jgi:uncharacterized membrane protein
VLAAMMLIAGVAHLLWPRAYLPAMPPWLLPQHHLLIIHVTGVLELLAAAGLMTRRLRRPAAWGLVAFFIAVSPANIHMAIHRVPLGGMDWPWLLWLRVALQLPLIGWAWTIARRPVRRNRR